MGCSKCSYYNWKVTRCIFGKINPRTVKAAVSAAAIMGIDYICNREGMKDKIVILSKLDKVKL